MLKYGFTVNKFKSDGFHGLPRSSNRGRPLEARHETKDFNGKPGRPWILTKNF